MQSALVAPVRHVLERIQTVSRPRAEVVRFFEDPRNLGELTPPFLHFRILTEGPIEMREGARIDYEIRLHSIPMVWKTLIEEYVPGEQFVDRQIEGPYRYWHHVHRFEDAEGGGTRIFDRVTYELPLGPLGALAHVVFVRRQLKEIFDYRFRVVEERFGTALRNQRASSSSPRK